MPRSKSFAKRVVRKIPAGFRQQLMGGVSKVAGNPFAQELASDMAAASAGTAASAAMPGSQVVAVPLAYGATRRGMSALSRYAAKQQQKIKVKRMEKRGKRSY